MTGFHAHAIGETNRRRAKQLAYNVEHNITPESIIKSVDMQLARIVEADYLTVPADDVAVDDLTSEDDLRRAIEQLEAQMREAAKKFEFERAASLRDRVRSLRQRDFTAIFDASPIELLATSAGLAEADNGAERPTPQSSAAPSTKPWHRPRRSEGRQTREEVAHVEPQTMPLRSSSSG